MSITQTLETYIKTKFNALGYADPEKAIEQAHDKLINEIVGALADFKGRLETLEAHVVALVIPAPVQNVIAPASSDGQPVAVVTADEHAAAISGLTSLLDDLSAKVHGFFNQSPTEPQPAQPEDVIASPAGEVVNQTAPVSDPSVHPQTVVDTTGGSAPEATSAAAATPATTA